MSVEPKQFRREIKEAREENILKQQTIDNLETYSNLMQKLKA